MRIKYAMITEKSNGIDAIVSLRSNKFLIGKTTGSVTVRIKLTKGDSSSNGSQEVMVLAINKSSRKNSKTVTDLTRIKTKTVNAYFASKPPSCSARIFSPESSTLLGVTT